MAVIPIVDKKDEKIIHLIRPEVQALQHYHVPPSRGLIKLDAMENPYSWPAYLRGEWLEEMQGVTLNRYPDPEATALKARLRQTFSIPAGMELLLGNDSDELIQIINLALKGRDSKVLAPEPSFSMYRMIAAYAGMPFVGVPLKADFSLDMPAMLAAIEEQQPAVIYLSYPNNPTGNLFAEEEVEQILRASRGLVVVDEAYTAFSGASFMGRLGEFSNLLILRTLSKMGLAGLRLGYLVGPSNWLREFDKLRLPYNINTLTQFTAEFVLRFEDEFEEQVEQIRRDRAWMAENMRRLKGVELFPSAANFVLFRVGKGQADRVHATLQKKGVLIKNMHGTHELLQDCLRVTVGKPSENVAFLSALTSAL
jgi:histidinol-phosphate aminotransferase